MGEALGFGDLVRGHLVNGAVMKKYETGTDVKGLIAVVEIEAEDRLSVTINGERFRKHAGGSRFFDSWAAARAYLVSRTERLALNAQQKLIERQGELDRVLALPEQEPE